MLILARVVTGIALAFTGQWAVMNTLLLIGMNEFAVFLIGIAVFVVIAEYTKFLTGGR